MMADETGKKLSANDSVMNDNHKNAVVIWCKLLINDEMIGNPTQLECNRSHVNIDSIKKMIKAEFSSRLEKFAASELEIYAANDNEAKIALKGSTEWESEIHGGDEEDTPLIVKVPKPPSVWITLFNENSKKISTKEIPIKTGSNIEAIKDAVKQVFPKYQNREDDIDLHVYSHHNITRTSLPLDTTWNPDTHGGHSEENALIVKVYDPEVEAKICLCHKFMDSIMKEYEEIPESGGMKVLKDVVNFETGEEDQTVVVRKISEPFWEKVIKIVETKNMRYRVCAVGTPGIGKTTTTAVLIRMLLLSEKTVFYHIREPEKRGWVYVFSPTKSSESINVRVFREKNFIPKAYVTNPDDYYVVDPGQTKDNCNPPVSFKGKCIIVSSADRRYWGESHFRKRLGKVEGRFCYHPVWEYYELLKSKPYFKIQMTDEELARRFRLFGGVPRNVFSSNTKDLNNDQEEALNDLKLDQVQRIAIRGMHSVISMDKLQPRSAILGVWTNETFENRICSFISDHVREKVTDRHMSDLWMLLSSNRDTFDTDIFESYCRRLLVLPLSNVTLKQHNKKTNKNKRFNDTTMEIGGCASIEISGNIVEDAAKKENVVFYPTNKQYPLIDCIYRKGTIFYAFQFTISKTHTAQPELVYNFVGNIVGYEKNATVQLIYMVPEWQYEDFGTKPVDPVSKASEVAATQTTNNQNRIITRAMSENRLSVYVMSVPQNQKSQSFAKKGSEDEGSVEQGHCETVYKTRSHAKKLKTETCRRRSS